MVWGQWKEKNSSLHKTGKKYQKRGVNCGKWQTRVRGLLNSLYAKEGANGANLESLTFSKYRQKWQKRQKIHHTQQTPFTPMLIYFGTFLLTFPEFCIIWGL